MTERKLQYIIRELEKWGSNAREQQRVSRDEKKQWYHLSESNTCSKVIGLIKQTFHYELSSHHNRSQLPLTKPNK